jgi:orotate phosphoribosyltransferase
VTPQETRILNLFEQTNAYLHGHFRLTSGLHSSEYLQCALVLQHPEHAESLGQQLAARLSEILQGVTANLVASPAVGGLIIGHEVARALGGRFVFTERGADGKMTLRRGFSVKPGEVAVVIEDVITTGGSTHEVVEVLESAGAQVVAAGSIMDRSGGSAQVGVPRVALGTLQVKAWLPEDCPLCKQGLPVVKPGSRQS